jgi:hypothetical protein
MAKSWPHTQKANTYTDDFNVEKEKGKELG